MLLCTLLHTPAAAQQPPAAIAAFQEGLAWLHSFEYEEALDAFRRAQAIHADFPLAYWGEAMCYHQLLWLNEDLDAGRRALARLGPTPAARAARARTDRERRYLAAADVLFGHGDRAGRVRAYAAAMRALASEYPDDPDAAAFYGLALLSETSRGLVDPGAHGDHDAEALTGSDRQAEIAAIFQTVLQAHPRHPGALHYLLHTYDDPEHARLALSAARVYPTVAPDASHALHMPAHIFLQLGMWAEASASDEASFRASEARVRRKNLPITVADYHSLSWLTYEYLQQGRYADAERTLAVIAPAVAAERDEDRLKALAATMQARVAVAAERWDLAAGPQYRNADELFAIGLGAAARGTPANAEAARQRLAEMAHRQAEVGRRTVIRLMERLLAASIAMRQGRGEEAVSVMRDAMALDAALPAPMGPPQPITPAPERFGEMLLELGRPAEARDQFAAALRRWPNRSRSVIGLARASAAAGDMREARTQYTRFLENWRDADPDQRDVAEARAFVAGAATSVPPWAAMTAAGAALAVALAVGWRWRRRYKKPGRPDNSDRPGQRRRPARTRSAG